MAASGADSGFFAIFAESRNHELALAAHNRDAQKDDRKGGAERKRRRRPEAKRPEAKRATGGRG